MIELTDIAVERTTAFTDILLAFVASLAAIHLYRIGTQDRWKSVLWFVIFILLAIAAILGSLAHGLKLPHEIQSVIWVPLYFCLGMLVALFVVAAVYDGRGKAVALRTLPFLLFIALGFFAVTQIWPENFLVFIIYEAIAMLFALGSYSYSTLKHRLRGGWYMVSGISATLLAAAVQSSHSLSITLIWVFDHNAIYHLIQIPGILLLVVGLRKSLLLDKTS